MTTGETVAARDPALPIARRAAVPLLATIVALAAFAASLSSAEASNQPRQIGPVVVMAKGSGWTLRAWRTTDGLCVSSYRPALADRAFCIPAAALKRGGADFGCLCRQRSGRTLFLGTVKPNVRRATMFDRRGATPVELYESPPALNTKLRFFRALAYSGSPPRWRFAAYDRLGNLVGSAGQGCR